MTHYKPQRTKMFCGRCLDGPLEGDWIEEDSLWFDCMIQQRIGPVSYGPDNGLSSIEIDRVFYAFLRSYRAWVWMQPNKQGRQKL